MADVVDELIELRGLRFHYRDWAGPRQAGPGPDAQDLVLLHGYTGHARSWDAFAEAMASDYRVLALDQRGHGETGWAPPDQYGTFEMVEDLEAFVAALGLDRFVLLGLSMGGIVAIEYAGRRPSALERLVIVDIAPEIAAEGMRNIGESVARSDVFESVDAAFARAREDNPVPPEAHHLHRVRHSLMRTEDGRWTYRYDRALRDPSIVRPRPSVEDGWRSVAAIDVPTLLIRGEDSNILDRSVADRMVRDIPDCRFVEVAGSGHSVPLDKPDRFLDAARTFL